MRETCSGDRRRAESTAVQVKTMAGARGLSSTCQHTLKGLVAPLHPERMQWEGCQQPEAKSRKTQESAGLRGFWA